MTIQTPDRLLREREVLTRFPISKSGWWAGISKGLYPQPLRIGLRAVAWRESDIQKLIENGITVDRKA